MRRNLDSKFRNSWQIVISALLVAILAITYVFKVTNKGEGDKVIDDYSIGITLDADTLINNRMIMLKLNSVILYRDSLNSISKTAPINIKLIKGKKQIELFEIHSGKEKLLLTDSIYFKGLPINFIRLYFSDLDQKNINLQFIDFGDI